MKTPKLVNAEKMAEANPKRFRIPSFKQRTSLTIGDFAKVCFNNERFWCEIVDNYWWDMLAELTTILSVKPN
jgi:hypothetical protein